MNKLISIVVPTYNEEENIPLLIPEIRKEMSENLPEYDYEILFIDNCSFDRTQAIIEEFCVQDTRIKAIFNARNFGQSNSPFHGLCQASGECAILLAADFQDPVQLLHTFVKEWEAGYKIVIGKKSKSRENKLMYLLRSAYYKIIRHFSDVEQIEHFTGFGLYDASFIKILRSLDDPSPYLRGIVAELGYRRREIAYTQENRLHGKSSYNWYRLYDVAMLGLTSYSKSLLRIAIFIGFLTVCLSLIAGIFYLVYKLIFWDTFDAGLAPLVIGVFFIGAVQLTFIGLLGEYILSINSRMMKRPLVIEEKRINC